MNTAQAAAWNGPVGAHWAEHADRYDAIAGGANDALLAAAAIRPHDEVLDVGCGNGQTTRLAAARASTGHVTGIDLSEAMLARARALAAADDLSNVSFDPGDAQVHPFPAGGFDVVLSRGGLMFFDDHVAAFTNIRYALRPGGRLAFIAPQETKPDSDSWRLFADLNARLREHVADDNGADPAPRMASLTDPARVRELLTAAGFTDIAVTHTDSPVIWGEDADDAAEFILDTARIRMDLGGVTADVVTSVRTDLHTKLLRHDTADGVRLPGAVWLVTATRSP